MYWTHERFPHPHRVMLSRSFCAAAPACLLEPFQGCTPQVLFAGAAVGLARVGYANVGCIVDLQSAAHFKWRRVTLNSSSWPTSHQIHSDYSPELLGFIVTDHDLKCTDFD